MADESKDRLAEFNDADERFFGSALRYLDGDLSAEDAAQWNQLLRSDPMSRVRFVELCTRGCLVRQMPAALKSRRRGTASSLSRKRWRWAAAVCALLASSVALLIAWRGNGRPDPANIADLQDIAGDVRVVTAEGQSQSMAAGSESGAPIKSGDTIRTRGTQSSVLIVYRDGTRLTLVGDTDVTCTDCGYKSVVVQQGTLAASVEPQPKGKPMVLATPTAQVEILGTQFLVEALRDQTDLSVTQGRVRLTRVSDGKAVDVPSGKRVVAVDRAELAVEDIPRAADDWEVNFEEGVPEDFGNGRFVQHRLPRGSRGAVAAVRSDKGHLGVFYEIRSAFRWCSGLFAVHDDSHLHFTYKMGRPGWINIFIQARDRNPQGAHSGNYLFNDLHAVRPGETSPTAGEWRTVSIPLAEFRQAGWGKGPPLSSENVPYCVFFSSPDDRELVIDRLWVTRGGPGAVRSQNAE